MITAALHDDAKDPKIQGLGFEFNTSGYFFALMQFDGTKIEDKSTMKLSLPLLLTTLGVSYAFTTSSVSTCTRNVQLSAKTDEQSRRSFVSAAIAVGASTIFAGPAFSDVSDGNTLPQGAAQFSRLLKVKNDLQVSIFVCHLV